MKRGAKAEQDAFRARLRRIERQGWLAGYQGKKRIPPQALMNYRWRYEGSRTPGERAWLKGYDNGLAVASRIKNRGTFLDNFRGAKP